VTDIQTSRKVVGSSLTALDLSGLTKVELGFAVALATGASGLLMALVLAERRRTFTIAAALGARAGQVASFARSEAAFVSVAGLLAATGAAWMLAEVLVRVLTGVFDPAPAHLAVPWGYLVTVIALALVAAGAAAEITVRASRRPVAEGLRDL
jgi:putative ABC transport system permease protein